MKDLADTIVTVVDHGLFVHVAQCIAQKAKHVYYTGPGEEVLRKLDKEKIGDGFENITRIKSPYNKKVKTDTDVYVFPDIGFEDEQLDLRERDYAVWGHLGAGALEENKGKFLRTLKNSGLEVPPCRVVQGITKLKALLWDESDKYVKISHWRGDWETFHWRNRVLDEQSLDCHAYRFGPNKEHITFYVFDKIDSAVEDGIDSWFIDNRWPSKVFHAMERKDKSLIGAMQDMDQIHKSVSIVNEAITPVLAEYGYRGFFSTEVRPPYFNDPTCRAGSPPSQVQCELIVNLPEVIVAGAHGECLEPEFDHVFGAQVVVTTDKEKGEWLVFQMPDKLRPHIKSAFACEVDGNLCIAPNPLENWAGWLTATGNSIEEVITTLKERKDLLPDGFECDITSMAHLIDELAEAKSQGIKITSQELPEPEIVL